MTEGWQWAILSLILDYRSLSKTPQSLPLDLNQCNDPMEERHLLNLQFQTAS